MDKRVKSQRVTLAVRRTSKREFLKEPTLVRSIIEAVRSRPVDAEWESSSIVHGPGWKGSGRKMLSYLTGICRRPRLVQGRVCAREGVETNSGLTFERLSVTRSLEIQLPVEWWQPIWICGLA